MATEREYDEQIAPLLVDVAERCEALGMSMVARVEWEPDEAGITQVGIGDNSGVSQRMAHLAVHARGNLNWLVIQCGRRFDLSQTVVGSMLKRNP